MCVLLIRENQRRLEGKLKPHRTGGGFSNFLLFLFWFDPTSVEAAPEHRRCYMLGPRIRVVVLANMFCRRLCHFTEPGFVSEGALRPERGPRVRHHKARSARRPVEGDAA